MRILSYLVCLFVYVVSVGFGVRHGSCSSSCFSVLCAVWLLVVGSFDGICLYNKYKWRQYTWVSPKLDYDFIFFFFSSFFFNFLSLSTTSKNQHSFASYFWACRWHLLGTFCIVAKLLRKISPKIHEYAEETCRWLPSTLLVAVWHLRWKYKRLVISFS